MEDMEDKKIKICEIFREEEERMIGFCKSIPGYDGVTELTLEGMLCRCDDEHDLNVDTIYVSDNLDYLNMIIIHPPILFTDLEEKHLSDYYFLYGCKMKSRNGYLMIISNEQGGEV